MSRRLPGRGCPSCLSWMLTPLLSPTHASCLTSNASGKAQCQHDCICRKSVLLLSTHLFLAERQAGGVNDPVARATYACPRHMAVLFCCLVPGLLVPPFAQPYNCSRKSAARGNPSLSQGQPHMCWGTLVFSSHRTEAWEGVPAALLMSKSWTK